LWVLRYFVLDVSTIDNLPAKERILVARHPGPVKERELACPACGHCWYADGREEYGVWFPADEESAYCPRCGVENASGAG
jgi:hypothetical protein